MTREPNFPACPFVLGFSDETGARELQVGEWRISSDTPLLLLLERGELLAHFSDGDRAISAHSILLLPPDQPLSATVKASGSVITVGFIPKEAMECSRPLVFPTSQTATRKAFLHLLGAYQTRELGWEYACLSDLYAILYALFRNSPAGNRRFLQTELIRPSVAYLERHITDRGLSMKEVAALSGVSETYFRSLFVKQFGCTPLQYVHQHRIQTVEQALSRGVPLSEAITLGGFCDRAHFLRIYQRVKGKPFSAQ